MSETNDAVCDVLEGAYAAHGNDINAAALALARDLVAAQQQLADVAYLAEWLRGHEERTLSRWSLSGFCASVDDSSVVKAVSPSLPALGARLRALSEVGR